MPENKLIISASFSSYCFPSVRQKSNFLIIVIITIFVTFRLPYLIEKKSSLIFSFLQLLSLVVIPNLDNNDVSKNYFELSELPSASFRQSHRPKNLAL